jgi:hypothetical protein
MRVLIIASQYDRATDYLYDWATDLRGFLLSSGGCDACIMLAAETLYTNADLLKDSVERSDHLVFFGHGERDKWIALPAAGAHSGAGSHSIALVDDTTVNDLQGKNIFSVCCYSGDTLGRAFNTKFPSAQFVGYKDTFCIHFDNQVYFKNIVRDGIVDFVLNSKSSFDIRDDLHTQWKQLDVDFSKNGRYQNYPDAWVAATSARANSTSVNYY